MKPNLEHLSSADPTSKPSSQVAESPLTDALDADLQKKYYAHSFRGPYDILIHHARKLESERADLLECLEAIVGWMEKRHPEAAENIPHTRAAISRAKATGAP